MMVFLLMTGSLREARILAADESQALVLMAYAPSTMRATPNR